MYMYVLLDVNEITAYDKRSATAWKPRGKLAGVKHSSRSGREGDMEDRGKKKERLGARLITWDQALFIIIIIFLLPCFFGSRGEKKNNAWYIYLTSHQPPPNLHNLTSAWPVMLLANQR